MRGGVSRNGLAPAESGGESLGFEPTPRPPAPLLSFASCLHGTHRLGSANPFLSRNFLSLALTTKLAPQPLSEHRIRVLSAGGHDTPSTASSPSSFVPSARIGIWLLLPW